MKPNQMGVSLLIISSFVVILCVYVYQEYLKRDVREEFEDMNYQDTSFVDYFERTDTNWKTLKNDIDSVKNDVSNLKKMALNGTIDNVVPNFDEIDHKVNKLTEDLSEIKNRMTTLENSMESMQSVLKQMDGIQVELLDIRNKMPDMRTTQMPSWATKADLDSLNSQMNKRMDIRKATVDASLQNVDGYYDEVMGSVNNRFNEYDGRLERHMGDMDKRIKSVRENQNAVLGHSMVNSDSQLEKLRSDVNGNKSAIKEMQDHHHEQYALIGEVNNRLEESVEKYLQNRTFNTNEFSHSNMRAQIEDIIKEQEGTNPIMEMHSMSNYVTRPEFQIVRDSQKQTDMSQNSRITNLNDSYEMKNVVTYGELDERLDRYVTKMRFASLFDEDQMGIMPVTSINPDGSNKPNGSNNTNFDPAPPIKYINELMK